MALKKRFAGLPTTKIAIRNIKREMPKKNNAKGAGHHSRL